MTGGMVEPVINVGICEGRSGLAAFLNGTFRLADRSLTGYLEISAADGIIRIKDGAGKESSHIKEAVLFPAPGATFTLKDVTIGVNFHWERRQEEIFPGELRLLAAGEDRFHVINRLGLEAYLAAVISSEMSASSPAEFLKAHAVISRSWLISMLGRRGRGSCRPAYTDAAEGEIIRWYDREDHEYFDVCADDHCQRYQGLGNVGAAAAAVTATEGLCLTYGGEVCDARFHKCCGGLTENYRTAWEERDVPYLTSISDAPVSYAPVATEERAIEWINSSPEAYCNIKDRKMLGEILPSFDRETVDFFRWRAVIAREELEEILQRKTGQDFGTLYDLIPLERGPSGRVFRLKIAGSKAALIVGKELEIRRLLSPSHLLSSAFYVEAVRNAAGVPEKFILSGAGWGHGVGLCQIGAAVMSAGGFTADAILRHYFPGTSLKKMY